MRTIRSGRAVTSCHSAIGGQGVLRRTQAGETARVFSADPTHVGIDEYTDMTAAQISYSHHYYVVGDKLETFSAPYRYVWPSELALMARLAGMRLRERVGGWQREPVTRDDLRSRSCWTG